MTERTRPQQAREIERSGFTPILEALVDDTSEALCATFVDAEGETVDLATRVPVFDARVAGAELALPLARAREMAKRRGLGEVIELRIAGDRRCVLARQVAAGCDLVMVVDGPSVRAKSAERCAEAARALCAEAGLPRPAGHSVLRGVELRGEAGDSPAAFDDDGVRRRVSAVLGVRVDGARGVWLVRAEDGEEIVLERDARQGVWRRR